MRDTDIKVYYDQPVPKSWLELEWDAIQESWTEAIAAIWDSSVQSAEQRNPTESEHAQAGFPVLKIVEAQKNLMAAFRLLAEIPGAMPEEEKAVRSLWDETVGLVAGIVPEARRVVGQPEPTFGFLPAVFVAAYPVVAAGIYGTVALSISAAAVFFCIGISDIATAIHQESQTRLKRVQYNYDLIKQGKPPLPDDGALLDIGGGGWGWGLAAGVALTALGTLWLARGK